MMTDLTATVFIFVGIISLNFEGIKGQGLPAGIKMDVDQIKTFLQNEITGPQDSGELATKVLTAAWNHNMNGASEVDAFNLLGNAVNMVAFDERLSLLRILEIMDKDLNGKITREEFVETYSGGLGAPDQALELMFETFDLDRNGVVTIWEQLNNILTLSGINQNLHDAWKDADHWINTKDTDLDGTVDLNDFILFMVQEMSIGISQIKPTPKTETVETPKDE